MLIGTDIELFLKRDGQVISAHGAVPGSKARPYPVKKGMVQVDGMALEFGIDPAPNFDTFQINVNTVLQRLQDLIPAGTEMSIDATAHFSKALMLVQPEEAIVLGCEADYNAYTGEENPPPKPHPTMRTAGGHIHIGFKEKDVDPHDPDHFQHCMAVSKQLDYYLGLIGVVHDNNLERKHMYGLPGAFRPKPYGIEYRVLSNFWLQNEGLMRIVHDGARQALDDMNNGRYWPQIFAKRSRLDAGTFSANQIMEAHAQDDAMRCMDEIGVRYEA